MDKVIAKTDFSFNGKDYLEDEIVEVDNYAQVIKLNERGLIKPLTYKELVLIQRELEKKEAKNEF